MALDYLLDPVPANGVMDEKMSGRTVKESLATRKVSRYSTTSKSKFPVLRLCRVT
jgi:hypothetical protein